MKNENIDLSSSDKLGLISNLSTMLGAGIPILETVESLEEDSKGNTKKILIALREDLMQGKHVYTTFSRFPSIFDKVTVNVIKASEEAGTLETTLKDIKSQVIKEMEFNDKIRSALIYPLVIVIVFIGVLLVMLIVVIPRISSVFSQLNVKLPLPTKIMIFASNLILQNTIPVLALLVLFCFSLFYLIKRKRSWLLHILFKLPLINGLIRDIDLTRFTRSLHFLLTSGITITNALELTEDVVVTPAIAKAISYAKETVFAGKKLSEGFKTKKNIFSGILIKIIEAGERSGTLDKSMQDISEFLDYQVTSKLKTLTTILEPVMLVFVGILVGGLMLTIIAPIYNLIGQVGAGAR